MPKRPIRGLSAGANIIEEERRVMATGKLLLVKLTEEQREEIREKLDKEVTHIKLSVVTGAVIFAEALELPER
jgi:hypothetical protein